MQDSINSAVTPLYATLPSEEIQQLRPIIQDAIGLGNATANSLLQDLNTNSTFTTH